MQTTPDMQPDDNLAAMHRNAKKRKKRKTAIITVVLAAAAMVVLVIGIGALRSRVTAQFGSAADNAVESFTVTTGSISTTVSGSGTLTAEGVEDVTLPSSLVIQDVYVEQGDRVQEGGLLATVTNASLTTAMSQLQEQIDELDVQLEKASGDTVSSIVKAGVSGRVKQINVVSGDDVATAMYTHGALAVLSLDGYLAADLETDSLSAGDTVSVILSDGTEESGVVEKVRSGTATILVTDNGVPNGDTVTVRDGEGTELGTAELYIHSPLSVTGYAGTVSNVQVRENQKVSASTVLLSLKDTATSVNYDSLLKQRAELEEQLWELLVIRKEGGICAHLSGVVESLDESGAGVFATISPEIRMTVTISVDEADILCLEEGQTASVTVASVGEESYVGTVTEINTTATSSSGVSVYSAVVTLDKAEGMLSGMTADVVITIEGVENALLIPVDALHQTRSSAYVYTAYDPESATFSGMVEVTTGLTGSTYVEITSGLKVGDTVYYTPEEEETGFFGFGGMGSMGAMPSGSESGSGKMTGDREFGGGRGGEMPGGQAPAN